MSFMNLLSYYDSEIPVPVDPHTDYNYTNYAGESIIFGPIIGDMKPPIDPISFMWECIKKIIRPKKQ